MLHKEGLTNSFPLSMQVLVRAMVPLLTGPTFTPLMLMQVFATPMAVVIGTVTLHKIAATRHYQFLIKSFRPLYP